MNKLLNKVLNYFKDLISNKTDADPKYFVGVFCVFLWGVIVVYHLVSNKEVQDAIIWANVGLIAACFGLEVVKNNTTSTKSVTKE